MRPAAHNPGPVPGMHSAGAWRVGRVQCMETVLCWRPSVTREFMNLLVRCTLGLGRCTVDECTRGVRLICVHGCDRRIICLCVWLGGRLQVGHWAMVTLAPCPSRAYHVYDGYTGPNLCWYQLEPNARVVIAEVNPVLSTECLLLSDGTTDKHHNRLWKLGIPRCVTGADRTVNAG